MTNQSENPFHTVEMFNFSPEGTKPEFDVILRGSKTKHFKRGEFTANVQIATIRVVRADLKIPGLDEEPMIVYAVVESGEFQDQSKVIEAFTLGGGVPIKLMNAVKKAVDRIDAFAMFK